MKNCLNCGKELTRKELKKFCSFECRVEYKHPDKHCLYCEKELVGTQKKYCSRKCRFDYEKEHIEDFKGFYKKRSSKNVKEPIITICIGCGKEFVHKRRNDGSKYCSVECYREDTKGIQIPQKPKPVKEKKYCLICGEEIIAYNKNRKYCSTKCAGVMSSERMKENNPSYNPKIVEKQKAGVRKFYEEHPEKLLERKENFLNAPIRGKENRDRKPTCLEQKVIDLELENVRFTGDGKFWVTFKNGKHKNADFKVKGQRKVIEVGDIEYWHTIEKIQETVENYKIANFECLYFTNRDIENNWNECVAKIVEFVKEVVVI